MRRHRNETDQEYIERLEREVNYYALLPDDYPKGTNTRGESDTIDIALRRAKSWASMWSVTHAGIDQQVRVCVALVCEELESLRAEVGQ